MNGMSEKDERNNGAIKAFRAKKNTLFVSVVDVETGTTAICTLDGKIDLNPLSRVAVQRLTEKIMAECGNIEFDIDQETLQADYSDGQWRTLIWNMKDGAEMPLIITFKQIK